jgi:2-(1,2-epoxy-1,2-dihydrophenyl)acetyl-CoA isomerase
VLRVTIDRPAAGNALRPDDRLIIIDALAEADRDPAVRAVLITATGDRHFCTGADLRAGAAPPPRPEGAPETIAGDISRGIRVNAQRFAAAVSDCEKPVIAAVNGTAAGLGMALALSCDFVIAADTARFIAVFVRRGLVPDSGAAYLLPRLVGLPRAKEILMLGDDLPAPRAYEMGLIYKVVPADQVLAEAEALAARFATGPTRALALSKWLLNRSLDSSRQAAYEDEAIAQDLNMQTHDGPEGVQAFVERRPPEFLGW